MKKLLLLAGVMFLLTSSEAAAHVLIKDVSGAKGAIVHIQPDDDPIAGEPATLYFDTQGTQNDTVSLKVRNIPTGKTDEIAPTTASGSLAALRYTFPTQGVYELTFKVSDENTYTFTKYQRVSRGIATNNSTSSTYVWAEMLFIASGIGLIVLFATFINHRKDIAVNSK